MFTAETGQQTAAAALGLTLHQLPAKTQTTAAGQHFPLIYGPSAGSAGTTAMFLPTAAGAAQAAAVASATQQQLQLQTHINNINNVGVATGQTQVQPQKYPHPAFTILRSKIGIPNGYG